MDLFAQLLFDLGKELGGEELYPDQNRLCQLNYMGELQIQLQYDDAKEKLIIGCFVCDVPAGKYREKLLKAALTSNNDYPRIGTLAYSERNNKLTLFEMVYVPNLKARVLHEKLMAFIEKAKLWKEAVEKGKPLPVSDGQPPPSGAMFGLK